MISPARMLVAQAIRSHTPLSLLILAALACNITARPAEFSAEPATPGPTPEQPAPSVLPASPAASAYPSPASSPSPTFLAPALDRHPLYWFAPLPPLKIVPGRSFIGSQDFMGLFSPEAAWSETAGHIQVFKLYGEWVAYSATDAELRQAVGDIQRRGLAIGVEAGPLNPPADCGQGVEGFAGIAEGLKIANRIRAAGGTLHLVALDEPFFFGHFYDGPNACHWPAEQIAQGVHEFIQAIRTVFPAVIVGDTEPLAGPTHPADYEAWLDTFRSVNGYDLAFIHMDIDWSRLDWPEEVKALEDFGRQRGIAVGLIYNGNGDDPTDEAWLSAAGERVRQYELEAGGRPDHVLFQSWNDHPDFVLPESKAYTFTNFIKTYFEDRAALGFRREGAGANLAFRKAATASRFQSGFEPELAVDGNPGTWWGAGESPPQWIEIALEAAYNIADIRLTISQSPAGETVHHVRGKGPGTGDVFALLHTFQGNTQDPEVLEYAPPQPWQGIQVIRIETVASPSWVAWREIEIIDAGG